ncbi:uncharacterized protein LOC111881081 [Lactuca sativa]|uniref:uncharacterized protein LOC111881081 n=1 Tax=Lactuca sativa TaxID=4236 RepID=UPI000CC856EB|nr:uncharacterized protein LOC111881081 [Lactuca sativa]
MAQTHFLLLLFVTIISFTTTQSQERSPHGLVYENPMAFSPSAYNFFHPKANPPTIQNPCDETSCAPLPMAATVQSSLAQESASRNVKSGSKIGAGGVAALIFGFIFMVLVAMGAYFVVTNRRTKMGRNNMVLPSV